MWGRVGVLHWLASCRVLPDRRYKRSDEKGRFVVPARYRESLGVGFVLTIYPPDPCLALFDAEAWDRVCSALEAQPQKSGEYRNFVRYIFGNTQQVSFDAQGRLVVRPSCAPTRGSTARSRSSGR